MRRPIQARVIAVMPAIELSVLLLSRTTESCDAVGWDLSFGGVNAVTDEFPNRLRTPGYLRDMGRMCE